MIEYKYCGFWRRLGAHLIDGIFAVIISFLLTAGIVFFYKIYDNHYVKLFLIIIVNLLVALFHSSRLQATPGKYFLKMKVINIEGSRISLSKALVRVLLTNFFYTIFYILDHAVPPILLNIDTIINIVSGLLLISTKQKTALHDIICKTRVVRCDSNGKIIKLNSSVDLINNVNDQEYNRI